MTIPVEWPALRGNETFLPEALRYERAVWGKLHGAASDFRWIARSSDFDAERSGVETQVGLGGEDLPALFVAWRSTGERCYAVAAYPSRAIDAAGRRGFLEKQVFEWRRQPSVPAAIGALLLLPHAFASTDAIWWDAWLRERGDDSAVPLPIGPEHHVPLAVDDDAIRMAMERGRDALRAAVPLEVLRDFYEQILAHERPAVLSGLSRPLSPEALAVLLLPLPRDEADRISIAGWLPASRPRYDDLSRRWDAIIIAPGQPIPAFRATADAKAARMAERLLAAESGLFSEWVDFDPVVPPVAARNVSRPTPASQRISVRPPDTHARPGMLLDLTPPAKEAGEFLLELYDFARSVDRRWLVPSQLQSRAIRRIAQDDPAALMLCDWVQQVIDGRPPHADRMQWDVKVDLLRSAALVLAPFPSTVAYVGLPKLESYVPGLLFGVLVAPRTADALAGMGGDALEKLLTQSLTCRGAGRWRATLRDWLTKWERASGRADVRERLRRHLAPPSSPQQFPSSF